MPVKNILVIGGNGSIGKPLAHRLRQHYPNAIISITSRIKIKNPFHVHVGDLNDSTYCKRILKKADLIYYLAAAKGNIAAHTSQTYDFFEGNISPLLTFLGELKKIRRPTQLIYLSSLLVSYAEKTPEDGYVLGKSACELALTAFQEQYRGNIKIVRSAAVYGPDKQPYNPNLSHFIPAMIYKARTSNDGKVVVWGNGKRQLQFIYIDDLVENLIAIAAVRNKKRFTIGNNRAMSVHEIAQMVIKLLGKKLIIQHDLSKPDKPSHLFRFKNVITPKISFREGILRMIQQDGIL